MWELALQKLSKDEREAIQFDNANKLTTITNLHHRVITAQEECKGKQWRYNRLNGKGESVIVRDTLSKLVKWVERFKQIGDTAVQYDPIHAALPWAGLRFLLEVCSINDAHPLTVIMFHRSRWGTLKILLSSPKGLK